MKTTTPTTPTTTTTTIHSNGSKWAGEEPNSLETLFENLERYTLDSVFEDYGNFAHMVAGRAYFFGNFADLSGVFRLDTNDPALIKRLTKAIRANQATPRYAEEKRARLARHAALLEHEATMRKRNAR